MAKKILLLVKSHFKPQLQALGYEVKALAFEGEYNLARTDAWSFDQCDGTFQDLATVSQILAQLAPFRPDYIIYHDDSNHYLRISDLHKSPVPTLFFSVDAHIHANLHSRLSLLFDHTFVAQKSYLSTHWGNHTAASWLPLWAPRMITPSPHKDIQVCFRGTLGLPQRQQRVDFLRQVAASAPLDYAEGDFTLAFPRAAIVLNEQIKDDINFRVFESVMCGACLVTPDSDNGLHELFTPGEHIVTYRPHDAQDAAAKITALLQNPPERERIAQAGRRHLLSHHLAEHRAGEIDRVLPQLRRTPHPHGEQLALYNLARWWGLKAGGFRSAPAPIMELFLNSLASIAAHSTSLADETAFICCEIAAAQWEAAYSQRLCETLQALASLGGSRAATFQLAESYLRQRGEPKASQQGPDELAAQAPELLQGVLRASPLRVFDRPVT